MKTCCSSDEPLQAKSHWLQPSSYLLCASLGHIFVFSCKWWKLFSVYLSVMNCSVVSMLEGGVCFHVCQCTEVLSHLGVSHKEVTSQLENNLHSTISEAFCVIDQLVNTSVSTARCTTPSLVVDFKEIVRCVLLLTPYYGVIGTSFKNIVPEPQTWLLL